MTIICPKCGTEHNRKHRYCKECHQAYCKAYYKRVSNNRKAMRRKTDRELAIILG